MLKNNRVYREKIFLLVSFLFVCGIKFLYSIFYSQESIKLKILRIAGLLVFASFSFLAYKGNKIATLIMAIVILFSGLGSLAVAGFISLEQLDLKIVFVLVGGFFTYGGIKLIIIARRKWVQ